MDVDFELYIKLWYYDDENGWKNYEVKLQEGSNNYIEVGIH